MILGRNAEAFLTDDALAKLRKWLTESEGSLVCFRGPPASQIGQRLGDLMPLRWAPAAESRFHVELTDAGQALRWLPVSGDGKSQLAELPSLATTARPEAAKALAVVLAKGVGGGTGQPSPMMVYQPVGSGRVVVVEGAGMWRWAFLAPEHQKQEEIYGSLWRSLVRWLVSNVGMLPSQRLALRADKLSFTTDENVTATLLVRDWSGDPPQVQLTGGPHARPQPFRCVPRGSYPGQFYVGLGRLPEGRYSLRVAGIDKNDVSGVAAFDVRGNLAERLDVCAQPNVMKMIARKAAARCWKPAIRGCWRSNSIGTSAAPGPNARRRRWPGIAGGRCSARSPSGARPGGSAADRDWCEKHRRRASRPQKCDAKRVRGSCPLATMRAGRPRVRGEETMISLGAQLRRVRRRLLGIGTAAAAVWGLAAVTILLLCGAWLDLLWEFPPEWRIATFWVAGVCGVVLLGALAAATLRAARDAAVARRLDRAGGVGGRILTGWELAQEGWSRRCGQSPRALTLSLANIAVADAAVAAGQIPLGKVAPLRPLGRSLGAIALLWAAVAVLAICLPGLVRTQWNRFARPFADVPPFSRIEFKVTPGNKPVVYGSELEIRATVIGPPVEQLELVLARATARSRRCRCFPRPTASGGRCWPRWSSRPITTSAPTAPAATGITSASSPCR